MNEFLHPKGKELPAHPAQMKPYTGWVHVGKENGGDEDGMLPIRDQSGTIGKKCPLLFRPERAGGEIKKLDATCLGPDCAMYQVDVKVYTRIDEKGQAVMRPDASGKMQPQILETSAVGMCAYTRMAEGTERLIELLKRLPQQISVEFASVMQQMVAAEQQQAGGPPAGPGLVLPR